MNCNCCCCCCIVSSIEMLLRTRYKSSSSCTSIMIYANENETRKIYELMMPLIFILFVVFWTCILQRASRANKTHLQFVNWPERRSRFQNEYQLNRALRAICTPANGLGGQLCRRTRWINILFPIKAKAKAFIFMTWIIVSWLYGHCHVCASTMRKHKKAASELLPIRDF